jgi:hypothetical protein
MGRSDVAATPGGERGERISSQSIEERLPSVIG